MGQNESRELVDQDTPTETLEARTIDAFAAYLRSGKAKRVVFLVGAGISTSAGIPDFRSPDTGLYANLKHLDLERPEDVFTIDFFRNNPLPFYTFAHELAPGKFRPTLTHSFMSLLNDKGLLYQVFTQNIDTLERQAGVPPAKLMEAHGSFATSGCINVACKEPYPNDLMAEHIKNKDIPHCNKCQDLVKPNIVFFGEMLPPEFFLKLSTIGSADLVIVMGSSLNVAPFSMLPERVSSGVPRLLINRELAGSIGSRADDVLYLGDCDDGIRHLAKACGWLSELEKKWAQTSATDDKDGVKVEKTADEKIEEEVEILQREIAQTLKIAETHRTSADDQTAKMLERLKQRDEKDVAVSKDEKDSPTKAESKPETSDDKTAAESIDGKSPGAKGKPVL
jgi:NAD-dependent histone deacetylase SIR2